MSSTSDANQLFAQLSDVTYFRIMASLATFLEPLNVLSSTQQYILVNKSVYNTSGIPVKTGSENHARGFREDKPKT